MSRTVLIVDDDPLIRRLIATTLEDVAGFELLEAGDGVEALKGAPEERAADRLPRHRHAAAGRHHGLPAAAPDPATAGATIVMLTACPTSPPSAAPREAGADLFLTKPFSPLRPAAARRDGALR